MGEIRGRLLARALSTSRRFQALHARAGPLAEFAQSLYPLLMTHADDYGRFDGDPWTVKQRVLPGSPRRLGHFARALDALTKVGLLYRYAVAGRTYYEINGFEQHQRLKFRAPSTFPAASKGRTEQNRTEQNKNRTERPRRDDLYGDLAACPHQPRCASLVMCRKIGDAEAAMAAGTVTAQEGARYIDLWRRELTMVRATLPPPTRRRAGTRR